MPRTRRARPKEGLYKHQRLRYMSNEIRLIELKPAKKIRDAVHCDIIVVSLDRVPNYEAVSYAWGNTSKLRAIGVNARQRMLVSDRLETALRYLRHQDKDRLLWVDATCINQSNVQERNKVVSKMHLIYARASRVVVWLGGPCRPWSFKPILDALAAGPSDKTDRFTWRCQILTKPHESARAIQGFANLPWFLRGWICQEICFAREVIAQYGSHTVPWPELEDMVVRLRFTAAGAVSGILYPEVHLLYRLMRNMSTLQDLRDQHHKEQPMELAHMIALSRTRMTSDPRDKIFAFTNLLSSVPVSLQPDYNKSTTGLFKEVCRLLIRGKTGLRLLAECEAMPKIDCGTSHGRMPSWVPDWSYTRRCEPLPGGLSHSFSGDSYLAGSNWEASFRHSARSAVLFVMGSIFDEIVFLKPLGRSVLWGGELHDILWENVPLSCRDGPTTNRADFYKHIVRMVQLDRTFEGKRTDNLENLYKSDEMENLRRVEGRSILLTSKGHLGWAPPAAETNDLVVVFPGCHVPIVLRRVHVEEIVDANQVRNHDANECTLSACQGDEPPYYRVIGEAYVQGIMEGEALASSCERDEQRQLREIALV